MVLAKPLLKWPGGKRKLAPEIMQHFHAEFDRYVEPFVGAGGVYFSLPAKPRRVWLNDLNTEVIDLYREIKKWGAARVVTQLEKWERHVDYHTVRDWALAELSDVQRAARTLYLNRYGFNGLYRVNSRGEFNVPEGSRRTPVKWDLENFEAVRKALRGARLTSYDFTRVLSKCGVGDLVYCDPPYDGGFTQYTAGGFTAGDQGTLALCCREAAARGARVFVSNSNTDLVRELYRGCLMYTIEARRSIAAKAKSRGVVTELLIEVRA